MKEGYQFGKGMAIGVLVIYTEISALAVAGYGIYLGGKKFIKFMKEHDELKKEQQEKYEDID